MRDQRKPAGRSKARSPATKPATTEHKPGEDIKHVINTGLPPGIDVEQAKDPGSQAPGGQVENRS